MNQKCHLWIGSLEPYMTDTFLLSAFIKMGEHPTDIKIMRNKLTGELAGYGFVHFPTDEVARTAMHKLNGKIIPNTSPVVRFKLNYAGSSSRPTVGGPDNEFSLWVGDLSLDVDDYALYKCFAARYSSIRTAKGFSKGYAFVRFASEEEQKNCCIQMNGYKGLGSRPIKVSGAVPKTPWKSKDETSSVSTSATSALSAAQSSAYDYTQSYYDPSSWHSYNWGAYYDQAGHQDTTSVIAAHAKEYSALQAAAEAMDELALIDHCVSINTDELNQEMINRDCDLWDAIESSKWTPVEIA